MLFFGIVGCNLVCKFCQNWDIFKFCEIDVLVSWVVLVDIVWIVYELGCCSVVFIYNDLMIFWEYVVDVVDVCYDQGIKVVVVMVGYMCFEFCVEFYWCVDVVNVDLKVFIEDFYCKVCVSYLCNVLDILVYLWYQMNVWLEIIILLIFGCNDSDVEVVVECRWICENLGVDVLVYFIVFYFDYKMMDILVILFVILI